MSTDLHMYIPESGHTHRQIDGDRDRDRDEGAYAKCHPIS